MPELPEVETVVRGLRAPLVGRTITGAWLDWPRGLIAPTPKEFQASLPGQTIHALRRRGKYILCDLDDAALIIHLKMTGRLYVAPDEAAFEADRWVHFMFQLDNAHQWRFSDARKLGTVHLTPDPERVISKLGPEPLDDTFTLAAFRQRLAGRRGLIKPLLLNQTFIAGIGNIYADEALHRAGVHPGRAADSLSEDEQARLYTGIRAALTTGLQLEGASVNWYRKPDGGRGRSQDRFRVYGRADLPCPVCGTPVQKMTIGGRGTHYCPTCQQT